MISYSKLKLIKTPTVLRSTLIFIILSIAFLYFTTVFVRDDSAYELKSMLVFIKANLFSLILSFFTFFAIKMGERKSIYLLGLFSVIVFYKVFSQFFVDNNKFILIISFLYLFFSFSISIVCYAEFSEAIYNPKFSENDLLLANSGMFHAKLYTEDERIYSGVLTNWSNLGCFMLLDSVVDDLDGRVRIVLEHDGKSFSFSGNVISLFETGVGVAMENLKSQPLSYGWKDFFEIISERAYMPLS